MSQLVANDERDILLRSRTRVIRINQQSRLAVRHWTKSRLTIKKRVTLIVDLTESPVLHGSHFEVANRNHVQFRKWIRNVEEIAIEVERASR